MKLFAILVELVTVFYIYIECTYKGCGVCMYLEYVCCAHASVGWLTISVMRRVMYVEYIFVRRGCRACRIIDETPVSPTGLSPSLILMTNVLPNISTNNIYL